MRGTLAGMDALARHQQLTDEFLDSLIRWCGLEAPIVLRKMTDVLERRPPDAAAD